MNTDDSDARQQIVADVLRKLVAQMSGDSKACLHCGADIDSLQQVGRSVYAHPCGCRQYQGIVPAAWQKKP